MTTMSPDDIKPLPKVPDPHHLEEHGVSIPAPTPTAISIPNPWRPVTDGAAGSQAQPKPAANGSTDSSQATD
jgi:hypothetical protein